MEENNQIVYDSQTDVWFAWYPIRCWGEDGKTTWTWLRDVVRYRRGSKRKYILLWDSFSKKRHEACRNQKVTKDIQI